MRRRVRAAIAAVAVAWGASPVVQAAPPTFLWPGAQPRVTALPAGTAPWSVFSSFTAGEQTQRYALPLTAGETDTLSLLTTVGAPSPELTVVAPNGAAFSLPSLPQPEAAWVGGVRVTRPIRYPYVASGQGTYLVIVQPGTPGRAQPYALQGGATRGSPLLPGPWGWADLWRGPVTWLQTLLWLWG